MTRPADLTIADRATALKEAKREVKYGMRNGAEPLAAARARRMLAGHVMRSYRSWRSRGDRANARHCLLVARGHLIVARAWDREAARHPKYLSSVDALIGPRPHRFDA